MKDWSYNFDPVSKDTWVSQIERELKGKGLQSLHSEWWPDAALDPIHHAADHSQRVHLPGYLFEHPPTIIESIDARGMKATQLNQTLLDALTYGAETILLHLDQALASDSEHWLNGVYADLVTWHITIDDHAQIPASFLRLANGKKYHRIDRGPNFINSKFDNHTLWSYTVPSTGNWTDNTARIFNTMLADQKIYTSLTGKSDFLQHCMLAAEADTHYLKAVIQLRTLQVIWQNLVSHYGNKHNQHHYMECHVTPHANEKDELYLIRATTSAVAAFLSGVPGLCIHSRQGSPDFYRRINRNIHHLLHMESGLPKLTDPFGGAYAIDHYTSAWATSIWDRMDLT